MALLFISMNYFLIFHYSIKPQPIRMRNCLFFTLLLQVYSTNLILNGDFQRSLTTAMNACPQNWTCGGFRYVYVSSIQYSYLTSQCLNLAPAWISQNISINQSGKYELKLVYRPYYQESSALQVTWNNTLIETFSGNNSVFYNGSVIFDIASQGDGTLNISTGKDLFVDNCSLILIKQTSLPNTSALLPKEVSEKVAMVLSAPVSSIPTFSALYLLLGDCWLFAYTHKQYKGVMKEVFITIQQMESSKLEAMSILINIQLNASVLNLSNYTDFTDPQFVEMQQSSTVLIEAIFSFFVFSVPQTILFSLIFYGVFKATKRCEKIRKFIRKYYFLKEMIICSLIEQNITYFVYVCCGHFQVSFCFKFMDKLALIFTIFIGFTILSFVFLFYFLLGRYTLNWTQNFNSNIIRSLRGHILLTVKGSFRSFVRGVIFFYLKNFVTSQMIVLGSFQMFFILIAIFMNKRKKTGLFEKKIWFCLSILSHSLFAGLHFSLAIEETFKEEYTKFPQIENIILRLETIILFLMGGGILSGMVMDFIPASWLENKLPQTKVFIEDRKSTQPQVKNEERKNEKEKSANQQLEKREKNYHKSKPKKYQTGNMTKRKKKESKEKNKVLAEKPDNRPRKNEVEKSRIQQKKNEEKERHFRRDKRHWRDKKIKQQQKSESANKSKPKVKKCRY